MSSKVKFFTRLFFCVFLSFLGLWSGQAMGSADNDVIGMRIGEVDFGGSRALRLVIETDKPLDAKLLLLHDP